MPKTIRQSQIERRRKKQIAALPATFLASIGNRAGTINAGNSSVYVTELLSGQTVTAKNFTVLPVRGRVVEVQNISGVLYIVKYWPMYGEAESVNVGVPPHTHEYTGGNADMIDVIRLLPLLVLPTSTSFVVQIYGGVIQASDGSWVKVANQTLDLTAFLPNPGACWVLIDADDAGLVAAVAGSTVAAKGLLTLAYVPTTTNTPLCAVRMYDGQTNVRRDPGGVNDFLDLRLFASRSGLSTLHNTMLDLQGGGDYLSGDEFYHLNLNQWEKLTHGVNADTMHSHAASGGPGGSDTQVQVNGSGVLVGYSWLRVNSTLEHLVIGTGDLGVASIGGLHVIGNSITPRFTLWSYGVSVAGVLDFYGARGADEASKAPLQSGDVIGRGQRAFAAYDDTGTTEWPAAPNTYIEAVASENQNATDQGAGWRVLTTPRGVAAGAGYVQGLLIDEYGLTIPERATDPANPDAGFWRIYPKADGLYYIDDAGNVIGPLAAAGSWNGDITDIDETSSADIGEALADGDEWIVFNTSASAWVRSALSRIWTYISSKFEPTPDYSDISTNDADTDVTGAEIETLSGGSNANALHIHSEYKLVSSISANDLVLALKDLDGNDFSAASPLKIKLSDELSTISAALSITKADATNWANLGGNELKTQDVDLFAYLIDETGASAGTKLGWSRIPNGHVVGNFSGTTTNEKYLAGPTNYNATDKVQNIGRFNATLSAGAGYTWTIPATSIIINSPTIHTRWLTWLPSFGNLTVGDGTLVSKYWISDDVLAIWFAFKFGATTSAISGAVSISLPISIGNTAVAASLGTCNLLDSGVGTTYASIDSNGASANNVRVRVITASGTYAALAPISATVPFTWAVNDEINFQLPSLPLA